MPATKHTVVNHSCQVFMVYIALVSAILSSEGTAIPQGAKRSRSVTDCVADSAVRLVRCGYTEGCILANFRCDGVMDCEDGSDESEATCRGGSACDQSRDPRCPNHSTCRSVVESQTRLAHHVCDCVDPFTGPNCTETKTTTVRQATTKVMDEAGQYSSTVTTKMSTSVISSRTQRAGSPHSLIQTPAVGLKNTTPSVFTPGFNKNYTDSSGGNTTVVASSHSLRARTDATIMTQLTSLATTDKQVNYSGTPTTRQQSNQRTHVMPEDVTNLSGTATIHENGPTPKVSTVSTPLVDTLTQLSIVSTVPLTSTGKENSSIQPMQHQPTVIPKPETILPDNGRVLYVPSSSLPPSDDAGLNSKTQGPVWWALGVVFGLLTLIPMAIFFHCWIRRKGFSMLDSKTKKDDEETIISDETQENSKPKHQRNISISSIKLKENSTLLGKELPLDVNMNKSAPIPPVILITPPPGSSVGAPSAMAQKRYWKKQNLPDTQLWFPDDGSEETPYFVTDNVPLPVSFV
ncbi:uncharacterized protein LOC110973861 [Acanthaster planci]|uniref:Uncharacterized protein LOC110973861 n=1 Tax=Acanthaster planci TaxID=133434 RepID=A0A8B7XKQ9_ACAPL|nr:uncharacterized protein LOC110973861 [Acanthaster planci]